MPAKISSSTVTAHFESKGAVLLSPYQGKDIPLVFLCSMPGCNVSHQVTWSNHIRKGSNPSLLCRHHLMLSVGKFQPSTEYLKREFSKKGSSLLSEYVNDSSPLTFECSEPGCNNLHTVSWNNYRNGRNSALRCQAHTYLGHPRGQDHPIWIEDKVAPWDQALFRPRQKAVFERHSYTCVISGQKGGELSAHHLEGRAKRPDLVYAPSNGVVLTRALHKEFHVEFCGGWVHSSTKEQFHEFFRLKTGFHFVQT